MTDKANVIYGNQESHGNLQNLRHTMKHYESYQRLRRDDARGARKATVSPEEGRPRLRITMSRPKATTTHGKLPDFLRITMSRRQGRPEAGRGIRGCEALQETKNPCADGRNGLGPVKILPIFEHFGNS